MLWGLLAASAPVIIHLLNRRRHKTVKWAAMQFLLKATRESRGKKRLRHILILTCRVLGLAALITAAALPIVSSFFGMGAGKPDLIVLVLDRSATMEAMPVNGTVSRRDLALQRVMNAMDTIGGTRLVLIDSASGTPQEVPSLDVLGELSSTAATDTASDLPDLLATASEFLAKTPGRAEIWVASDLQVSNWSPADDRWNSVRASLSNLPQAPRIRVLGLTGDTSSNTSLRVISSRRTADRLYLEVLVTRSGDAQAPLQVPLTTTIGGSKSTENLTITGQQLRFLKSLPLTEDDTRGYGWLSIPGDGNPRDNYAYFAYGPAQPVNSLIVAQAGEAASYLTLASAPEGFSGQNSKRVDVNALSNEITGNLAAIFWAGPLPKGKTADDIESFLQDGGECVFFAPEMDDETEFLGLSWSDVTYADRDKFFILDSWNRSDGLLRDGIDGTPIPAEKLRAVKRRIPTGDQGTIIASWDDTEPFLIRRVVGSGTAWFVGSQADYRWSNLPDAEVLLPIAQRTVAAGSSRLESGHLTELGSIEAELGPGEVLERLDSDIPAGSADPAYQAGIFRINDRIVARNRPENEDLEGRIDDDTLEQTFEGTTYSLFEDTSTSSQETISRGIWRAFLIAMLFFLLAEALLCIPKLLPPPILPATPDPSKS